MKSTKVKEIKKVDNSVIYAYISCLIQNAKDEAADIMRQLQGAESEVKALRSITQRMIFTQKEMVRIRKDSSG